MITPQPLQLVAFEGCPPSLSRVAKRVLAKYVKTCFLCILKPAEDCDPIKQAWMFSIQPIDAWLCLYIIREPRGHMFEGIAEFVAELAATRHAEVDVLFLSEDASWRGSRRLAKELQALQTKLERLATNSLVRRI